MALTACSCCQVSFNLPSQSLPSKAEPLPGTISKLSLFLSCLLYWTSTKITPLVFIYSAVYVFKMLVWCVTLGLLSAF